MKRISLGPMSVELQVWSQLKLLILPHVTAAFAPAARSYSQAAVASSEQAGEAGGGSVLRLELQGGKAFRPLKQKTHLVTRGESTLSCLDSISRKVGLQIKNQKKQEKKQGYNQLLSAGQWSLLI